MLAALFALEAVVLLLLLFLLFRRPGAAPASPPDGRLEQLLAADLPRQMALNDGRNEAQDRQLRAELAQLRQEAAEHALRHGAAQARHAEALRAEVLQGLQALGEHLRGSLEGLRGESRSDAEHLRHGMEGHVRGIVDRLHNFTADASRHHAESHDALHLRLRDLAQAHGESHDRLRESVERRLELLNQTNTAKLEEMRATVDEKLHATLQTRLTESFGAVADQLTRVHSGLGEMSRLSAGVEDLSRLFTNVKSRGGFAEVQLGMLLNQMLAPGQFRQNVKVRPNSPEVVEYAVRVPASQGELLLPIDAKFPREDWERLEAAYTSGPSAIAAAGKAFETAIRTEAKRICDKYIAPPATTDFAIMFLPTEGLYAEVVRRDGLQSEIQSRCRVTIAGPSTLSAILSSFQMGFHMLNLQHKGDEVWKVLAAARREFGTFEHLMGSMERQVGTVQNTIEKLNVRTRAIHRTLRDVSLEEEHPELPATGVPGLSPEQALLMPAVPVPGE